MDQRIETLLQAGVAAHPWVIAGLAASTQLDSFAAVPVPAPVIIWHTTVRV